MKHHWLTIEDALKLHPERAVRGYDPRVPARHQRIVNDVLVKGMKRREVAKKHSVSLNHVHVQIAAYKQRKRDQIRSNRSSLTSPKHITYDDPTLGDRILARVRHTASGCWLWENALTKDGFGQVQEKLSSGKWRTWSAHRAAYEWFEGPIPDGLELVPDRRGCVNPAHMRLLTRREQIHRPDNRSIPSRNFRKKFCRKGHRLTAENTFTTPDGNRGCLVCRREYYREHRDKLLAQSKARYKRLARL